tara:strand:+ start:4543 stop:5622 length:1080 start_codon:yes stop_codon:yes gene_type:complete
MPTIAFYARGDSSSANNAALNAQNTNQTPTTLLTFTSGTSGNLKLEANGGLPDPNTQVIINGVTQSFTLAFSGTLPLTNKLKNVAGADLRGKQIAVIIAANGKRYFFLADGSGTLSIMNAFPNGAHKIEALSTTAPVLVCFVRGTLITTPSGPQPVQTLQPGDLVDTTDGRTIPLRWIGCRTVSPAELMLYPQLRPIVIPPDMFGPGLPSRNLRVSAQHRIATGGAQSELLFGEDTRLVRAHHLLGHGARRGLPRNPVAYFHLFFDEHALIIANDLPCESFQPGDSTLLSIDAQSLGELQAKAASAGQPDILKRADCFPTLSYGQAQVLLTDMAGPIRQARTGPARQTAGASPISESRP